MEITAQSNARCPLPVRVLEVSPRGHFWQLIVQAEGWHDEPLSVVLSDNNGQSTPVRGDRFYVGGLNGRMYSGDDQLQPVALAKSA
jgi:sulfate transport system ATP-binding protein